MGITALVIAIIVIVNLIAGQIPEKYKNLDVSSTKIYEIFQDQQKAAQDMDHKVKFYSVGQTKKRPMKESLHF